MSGSCVWCGHTGEMRLHASVEWGELKSSWYRCASCSSLMILPRPPKEELSKVYEDDYLNKRLQPHAGVDSRIRYAKEYRPTVYAEYELSLRDLGVQKDEVRSVLDFGCADGVFLEFCKTHFPPETELWGTDVSESMLAQAKENGWNVLPVARLGELQKKFDLIALWDVLEHLEEPAAEISLLSSLLAPGGRIVLQTPRFGLLGESFGEHWSHLLPVQHLSIASKEGMERFAERMGLVIAAHKTFGAHAAPSAVPQPYKGVYDRLAKTLDFGDTQIVSLKRKT